MAEQVPQILGIPPLRLNVSFRAISPKVNPDNGREEGIITRIFSHRFTATASQPIDFGSTQYAVYRKNIFGRAKYVPTFESPSKRALQIETRFVIFHSQILLATVLPTLILAEFNTSLSQPPRSFPLRRRV